MNKKMQLVLDIMKLGIEISKTTKAYVDVGYDGSVDQLSVRCWVDGWGHIDSNQTIDVEIYLDENCMNTEDKIINSLEKTYSELAKYKEGENE